jgi:hypothetical protein
MHRALYPSKPAPLVHRTQPLRSVRPGAIIGLSSTPQVAATSHESFDRKLIFLTNFQTVFTLHHGHWSGYPQVYVRFARKCYLGSASTGMCHA